jgi:predicted DNA-binding transcriptional regulator YafY
MQTIVQSVEANTLRTLLRAIEKRNEIDIDYQSLTNGRTRTIAPHSLAFDGHRWHARAWCVERQEFRDFVLKRIRSVGESRPSASDPTDDMEWNTMVELKIVPHAKLTEPQKAAIELDYGMQQGLLSVQIRTALAFYFIKHHNLDLDRDDIPPERKQIFLSNSAEVQEAIRAAKEQTQARVARRG